MKIGYVSRFYFPKTTGGGEIHLNQIMTRANASGHDVKLLTLDSSQNESEMRVLSTDVGGFPGSVLTGQDPLIPYSSNVKELNFYKQFLRSEKFDLLHFYNLHNLIPFLIASLQLKIPTIITSLDFFLFCRRSDHMRYGFDFCPLGTQGSECERCASITWSRIHTIAARSAISLFGAYDHDVRRSVKSYTRKDFLPSLGQGAISRAIETVRKELLLGNVRLVAPSLYMGKFLRSNGIPDSKIRALPYGTDLVAKTPKNISIYEFRIGFIGRCVPQKGIITLLKAMEKLQSKQKITLDVYFPETGGEFVQLVMDHASRLSNTEIRGRAERCDLQEIFSKMDFLVVPSEWPENSPIIISEAHACGVPVLCSNFLGIEDKSLDEAGIIFYRMGDVDDLAAKIIEFCDRSKLSCLVAEIPPIPSIQETYKNIEALYQEV